MPTWRCPHCGARQPESSRCWVCKRSSTCCSTCRHYRRGMAGGLGYCAMDRRRAALSGDEIRGCWEVAPGDGRPPDSAPWASRIIDPSLGGRRSRLDFVPVEEVRGSGAIAPPPAGRTGGHGPGGPAPAGDPGAFRYQLWDDAEA